MNEKYSLILLDRDGVINRKAPAHTYITSFEQVKFIPKAKQAIALLSQHHKIAIISNQKGVSKGSMSIEDVEKINKQMIKEIEQAGGRVDKIYFCPHGEDECNCRKPKPGMIEQALKDFNLPKEKAVLLGDFFSDYETSKNVGCDFIHIDSESDEQQIHRQKFQDAGVKPLTFSTLYEVAIFLTK